MTSTDHVLDAIDHALEDWEVSQDAMRWAPEVATPRGSARVWIAPVGSPMPVVHGLWQNVGWTDETHLFRENVDLRPYLETIRRDIRDLAVTYRMPPPPDVYELYDEDWNDHSGTSIVRYQRADGAWITDTITRASDGVERLDDRRIETVRDGLDRPDA